MKRKEATKKSTRNPMAGLLRVIGRPQRVPDKRRKLLQRTLDREVRA